MAFHIFQTVQALPEFIGFYAVDQHKIMLNFVLVEVEEEKERYFPNKFLLQIHKNKPAAFRSHIILKLCPFVCSLSNFSMKAFEVC